MTNNLFDLNGKVALVTGAARGIGKAIAFGLANHGANVIVADVLMKEAEDTALEIQKKGKKAVVLKLDVTKKRDIEKAIKKTVKEFGKIDLLINNAGIFKITAIENFNEADYDKIMAVNLKGYFLCAYEASKEMIKQKSGNIINIASIAGHTAFVQASVYNATKASILLLTKSLAIELAKYNIRVNSISPGVISTAMTQDMLKTQEFRQMIKSRVPLARHGKSEEIVGAVIFLASEASSYVTGADIIIDGGWTASL